MSCVEFGRLVCTCDIKHLFLGRHIGSSLQFEPKSEARKRVFPTQASLYEWTLAEHLSFQAPLTCSEYATYAVIYIVHGHLDAPGWLCRRDQSALAAALEEGEIIRRHAMHLFP